ncbi:MAG: MerR family transcriptional regulator [candidate division WOR-3 bacterium]|nr:MerR family transcriptional regulator [candidate division WOR-3 bacterium]MDH5684542.1 MerR family transcriptional regulator [candidate division WOR-3 bacterium]
MAIKNKKFYSVSQTCRIVGVRPHILKHWEKQFELKPTKNSAGRRIYSSNDVEKLALIRHLLYKDLYTIQGAKRKLAAMRKFSTGKTDKKEYQNALLNLKKELIALKTQLTAE